MKKPAEKKPVQSVPTPTAVEKKPSASAPAPAPEKGLQIIEMLVENIKRVRFARIKPGSDVIYVGGANGSGKTSVLDAIAWALTGTSTVPSQPIRKGERTGKVELDLGAFHVTRHFTRIDPDKSAKGNTFITKLIVEGRDREQYRSPQELLNGLMGAISFDPLAFTRMDEKKQMETLRGLVKIDVDIDALDAEQKADYDQRRDAGRDVDSAKARLAALPEPPETLPSKPIDVQDLVAKLDEAVQHNKAAADAEHQKASLLAAAKSNAREIIELGSQIAQLQQRIEALRRNGSEAEEAAAAVVVPEIIDTASFSAKIAQASTTNQLIQRNALYNSVKQQLEGAEEAWNAIDARMKERAAARAAALAAAKMPIEGMGIGDGEVLYQGLPFAQASTAEQIRVSTALAMASNPKLRVLRIADGSLLDDKSLKVLTTMAKTEGYQLWIERVGTSSKVGVVMEDGEATGVDAVAEGAK